MDQVSDKKNREENWIEELSIKEALKNLTKREQNIIELRFFEDKPLNEIAEILGENLSTVKSRLYRGIRKLRIQLADE